MGIWQKGREAEAAEMDNETGDEIGGGEEAPRKGGFLLVSV